MKEIIRLIKKKSDILELKELYQNCDDETKSDELVCFALILQNERMIKYLVPEVKRSLSFISMAVKERENVLKYIDNDLKVNDDYMYEIAKKHIWSMRYLNKKYKNDKKLIMDLLEVDVSVYFFISKFLQKDVDIVDKLLKISPNSFVTIDPKYKNMEKYALNAVIVDTANYQSVGKEIQGKDAIIFATLSNDVNKRLNSFFSCLPINKIKDTDFLMNILEKIYHNNEEYLMNIKKDNFETLLNNGDVKRIFNKYYSNSFEDEMIKNNHLVIDIYKRLLSVEMGVDIEKSLKKTRKFKF